VSKITYENKKGKIIIINRISYPETINERIYNSITSDAFSDYLPLSIYQKRKEVRVECVVQDMIPLNQYCSGIISKKVFLNLVYKIALQIKECEKNMLNENNLDLQMDRIFFDPNTKKIKYIFWPVVNYQNAIPPYYFLKQLPYELNFKFYEDNKYLETYQHFFNNNTPFSINDFIRMILELLEKTNGSNEIGRMSESSDKIRKTYEKEMELQKKRNIEYDPFSECEESLDNCKSSLEIKQEKKNEKEELTSNGTIDFEQMGDGDEPERTTVLKYDHYRRAVYPILTRVKTKEEFIINTSVFRIGRISKEVGELLIDNKFVSRRHAEIITRENKFYIVDKNSKNRTFVNGESIPTEILVEILPGAHICFGDEEFIFNIKM